MTVDVGLCIILHPHDQRILIARRPQGVHLSGAWEFPGGKVEQGESPETCAVREALEEVGLDVSVVGTLPTVTHAYAERTVRLHPLICRARSGQAQAQASSEVRWVTLAELPLVPFPDANRSIVDALMRWMDAER
ncbi:MAG: (deoxy)nucleoside triphosphate pyrophosphohydrolase [Capsulimonadaceae bacterium]|nr:(deoxy)nucleoside triphosphate pyrophosphohydrolase [Capsulimonadaceae bacterium]